jgi:hypothetical protein
MPLISLFDCLVVFLTVTDQLLPAVSVSQLCFQFFGNCDVGKCDYHTVDPVVQGAVWEDA